MDAIVNFLKECTGFHTLPKTKLLSLAKNLNLEYFPKGSRIMVEDQTKVQNVLLIEIGALQLSWESKSLHDLEKVVLERGDVFGGISILLNNSVSIRTVTAVKDCFIYLLPKKDFLRVCEENPKLQNEFKNFFGEGVTEQFIKDNQNRYWERLQEMNLENYAAIEDYVDKNYISCSTGTTIEFALTRMLSYGKGAIMVLENSVLKGLVTYKDFCSKVILENLSPMDIVDKLMEINVQTMEPEKPLLEGLTRMARYGVHHLPIVDSKGIVCGILSARDMPQTRKDSSLNLLNRIRETKRPEDLSFVQQDLTKATSSLQLQGFAVDPITRFIAHANDAVVQKVLDCSLNKLGPPPCPFGFVVFGSEGREEQTLVVDQDNGIVFSPLKSNKETCRTYFLKLGRFICDYLDDLGYYHCKGGVMSCKPECCLTHQEWYERFAKWITVPNPENIMHSQIYFDMRAIYEEEKIVYNLMNKVFKLLDKSSDFFIHSAVQSLLNNRPPIGHFNKIAVEAKGSHKKKISLKLVMNHLIELIRIKSLKNGIRDTHTLDRLKKLTLLNVFSEKDSRDIVRAYQSLMSMRLQLQEKYILKGEKGSNYINPQTLTSLELKVFKASLLLVQDLHRKLRLAYPSQ